MRCSELVMCAAKHFGWHPFESIFLIACVAVHGTSSTSSNTGLILEEVLEEAPKWKVLRVSQ